ncbi:DUF4406 domain-containing protein [Pectobacterium carotovorum]|uniref:DUF4406 domain-containing protein n=1 Tax=Pectobacterium carotovorum TaxID=554 RepID=UPI002080D6B2|nr:DUF4406 domain-containing protein [Pectobacterium carotovorum]GKV89312.1 hypothetical protein PEC301619_12940 [Pectobacterium carotovorum subsp. carotovorum]
MKIYISGPMTGIADFNRPAFNSVAEKITANGHAALNPAALPDGLEQSEYMLICMAMLQVADAILLLPEWEKSLGAQAEFALAQKLGLIVEVAKL